MAQVYQYILKFRLAEDEQEKERDVKLKIAKKIKAKINKKIENLALEGKNVTIKDLAKEYNLDEYDDEYKDKPCCPSINFKRGGGVKILVIWDIFSFGLAVLFFYQSYKIEAYNFMEAKGHVYFTKWIYSCLSLPFLFFNLPLLNSLVNRAKPTGYDQWGNTVPIKANINYIDDDDDDDDDYLLDDIDLEQQTDTKQSESNNK
ncbi:hypothetical protein IMG5_162400 [Ichthyophthirius multifiliis]|uniref:Uncharacterized protein n=1 Tax=Ichthyophthirius multifiliis TaxID=5932 RepID=G0R077_ICHMU|nr:hypothetical protein IMG5_162400 [Ichthyophthirius multifiliis]EGR29137.1 hypothetical protein IMG5_162400 [Ichthyophthirius multifiliis]|eukprot:XP_004030373.1 hypothetical protein IMG5_162400 [Ichthyophthirius multifiliis]